MLQFTATAFFTSSALLGAIALPSPAATISYAGDTTGAPTFNRPEAPGFFEGVNDGIDDPIELSTLGTMVSYVSQPFTVDVSGAYNIIGAQDFDAVQFIYQTLFNPAMPLANLLIGNDPFPDTGNSSFIAQPLMAGTQYILVTTGFDTPGSSESISVGMFSNTITGPGMIALGTPAEAIPEPTTVAGTIALGLFGGGLKLKRQLRQRR